jgi:hypothetical protein
LFSGCSRKQAFIDCALPTSATKKMDPSILLILTGENCENAVKAALDFAQATSKRLRVLQILTSDLYHYGHQDLVATRPSKREFLLHIRDEVLERGKAHIQALEQTAGEIGIALDIASVESEDIFSTSLAEAENGYDIVFLSKQKKRLFPLFKITLAEHLQRKFPGKVVPC